MGNDSSKHPQHGKEDGTKKSQSSSVIAALKPGPSNSTIQKHLDMAKKSRVLSLKGSNLKNVPDAVLEVAPLIRSLDLSQNRLQSLRKFFGEFEMLKQLHLNDNALISLPDELGNLKKLEVLNLNGNQLTSLPDTLVGCMALHHLNLSNNQFSEFPNVVCLLPRADIVDISHNSIRELPDDVRFLNLSF
uniref:Leucine-rich repeat protein n=1 Tax=Panagrolaimus sp. JU765 TaxID=591449 RepID=A0AC34QCT5_9BILA